MKRVFALLLALLTVLLVSCGASKQEKKPSEAGRSDVTASGAANYVPAQTEPPKEIVHKKITFAAAGDNIIYQAGFTDAKNRADGGREYDFRPNYDHIRSMIESADLAFVNQETLMAGADYGYSDYPHFNSPQQLLYDLDEVGFDIVSMANNHMLDMGTSGIEDCIAFYKGYDGVQMIGGYESEEDFYTPRVVECDGIKIAFVAFTYATNGLSLKEGSDVYIPYIDDEAIEKSIALAKEQADLVFVSCHWGIENDFDPSDDQKHTAQLIADCGADVIIGHHPHVIQPVEWLDGKDGNKTLCIYSLGDFMAVMMRASNMLGAIVTFDIAQDGDEFSIQNPVFNPTVFHFGPSYYKGQIYFLSDFTSDLASTFGNVYNITADYDDLCRIVTETVDEEFLPDYLKTADTAETTEE